jgi:hypothetical protein
MVETIQELEQLVRRVVDEREFEIRIADFVGDVAITVLDENDPRKGCAQLRGESSVGHRGTLLIALIDACEQALRDEYPQATGCGRGVKKIGYRWTNCILDKVHDGPCRDQHGNTETS